MNAGTEPERLAECVRRALHRLRLPSARTTCQHTRAHFCRLGGSRNNSSPGARTAVRELTRRWWTNVVVLRRTRHAHAANLVAYASCHGRLTSGVASRTA